MVERRSIGGWLDGPSVASDTSSVFPGQRLGRPQAGSGALGRPLRRFVALGVDWALALLIANALVRPIGWGAFGPLAVLLVENLLLVGTAGATLGHRLLGLRVETLVGQRPGPTAVLVRAVLLVLAVPALVWDVDQRGLHDKAAGTVIARR